MKLKISRSSSQSMCSLMYQKDWKHHRNITTLSGRETIGKVVPVLLKSQTPKSALAYVSLTLLPPNTPIHSKDWC